MSFGYLRGSMVKKIAYPMRFGPHYTKTFGGKTHKISDSFFFLNILSWKISELPIVVPLKAGYWQVKSIINEQRN